MRSSILARCALGTCAWFGLKTSSKANLCGVAFEPTVNAMSVSSICEQCAFMLPPFDGTMVRGWASILTVSLNAPSRGFSVFSRWFSGLNRMTTRTDAECDDIRDLVADGRYVYVLCICGPIKAERAGLSCALFSGV